MKASVSRRMIIRAGIFGGAAGLVSVPEAAAESAVTPAEIEGPFYPVIAQKDKDFDLTRIEGREERAKGEVIEIRGRVLDSDGRPIEDATVDLWQANAAGRYNHPGDPNKEALDQNFQGWAIVPSGKDGGFRFKTVKPGVYPAANDWDRPPHIHFKVTKFGFQPLTTQMYFPSHPLNAKDILLQRKNAEEQAMMIARPSKDEDGVFNYDIILAGAREGKAKQAE